MNAYLHTRFLQIEEIGSRFFEVFFTGDSEDLTSGDSYKYEALDR